MSPATVFCGPRRVIRSQAQGIRREVGHEGGHRGTARVSTGLGVAPTDPRCVGVLDERSQLAVEHILASGNPFERWRALRLSGARTGKEPPVGWAPIQNTNGGFRRPHSTSAVSCTGATSAMLLTMVFLGLENTPEAHRALSYIWGSQQPDGRWAETVDGDSDPPPPWFRPGVVEVDLWETANIVATLAAMGLGDDPRVKKGIEWAERHARADGGFPGYIHTTYGMASVQYRLGAMDPAEQHLRYSGAFLETGPDVHDLNWGLKLFYIGAIPSEHPVVRSYLDALVRTQGSDGLWPTIYTGSETTFTLEALEVLKAYGIWQPR